MEIFDKNKKNCQLISGESLELENKYRNLVNTCLMFESNTYRTMRDTAWKTHNEEISSQTLFSDLHKILLPYCEQQCSNVPRDKNLPGSDYLEWEKDKMTSYDEEFFDTNTGCFAMASYCGLNPDLGVEIVPPTPPKTYETWISKLKRQETETKPLTVSSLWR
jgi:hypothetical protein